MDQLTLAMLVAILPIAHIARTIIPVHFTVPIATIIGIEALVHIARLPNKFAFSMLHVGLELPLILVAIGLVVLSPAPVPLLHPLDEVTSVGRIVTPIVGALARGFSVLVLTRENIAVREYICALTVFQGVFPLAFVSITIFPAVHALAIGFTVLPLTCVLIALVASPDAMPVLNAVEPLTVVDLSVGPSVQALSMRLILDIDSQVLAAGREDLEALTVSLVIFPLAFIDSAILVDKHAQSRAQVVFETAEIERGFVSLYCELLLKLKGFEIE
jgi:hypothetical protein